MSKVKVFLCLLTVVCLHLYAAPAPKADRQPVDWVNPFIGTTHPLEEPTAGLRWMQFPGPAMPFGMVKLSPDNRSRKDWRDWSAGYDYHIGTILGFSHIHSWEMAGLLMMPTTGPLKLVQGPDAGSPESFRSHFRHETEKASAGLLRGDVGRLQDPRRTDRHHARGIPALHLPPSGPGSHLDGAGCARRDEQCGEACRHPPGEQHRDRGGIGTRQLEA